MLKRNPGSLPKASCRQFVAAGILLFGLISLAAAQSQTTSVATGNGSHPYAVAVNPVTNQIYVADYGTASVTVINGSNNTQTTIPVGTNTATSTPMVNPVAVAVNPVTNTIYVANAGTAAKTYKDGGVTVINGGTNTVSTTISVPNSPVALAVDVALNKVFVAEFANQGSSWYVGIVDGPTNNLTQVLSKYVSGTVTVLGAQPVGVAVNPLNHQVFFANSAGNNLTVMDGVGETFIGGAYVAPASRPAAVAINPVLNHAYVLCNLSSPPSVSPAVDVIDLSQNGTYGVGKLIKTVTVGNAPTGLAVNPVTNSVYVANSGETFVTVIQDGATVGNGQTIPVGNSPAGIIVNPITNKVFVSNLNSNSVSVIDAASNTVTATVAAGTKPGAIAANPVTNKVYVANSGDSVTVVDGAANSAKVAFTGAGPAAVGVNPVTAKVYVANQTGNNVTVIDETNNTTSTVTSVGGPVAVAVDPVLNKIYVANVLAGSVTAIDGSTDKPVTVRAGAHPTAVAVNPVTSMVYVANQGTLTKGYQDSSVTVINGANNIVSNTVPFGSAGPAAPLAAIAVDPFINQVYVVSTGTSVNSYGDGAVFMFSGADPSGYDSTVPPIQFPPPGTYPSLKPVAIAVGPFDPNTGFDLVYVANYASSTVDIWGWDGTVQGTIQVGTNPTAIAVNPATGNAYTANSGGNSVSAINEYRDTFGNLQFGVTSISTGAVPYAIAIDPTTNKIFAPDKSSNNVAIIDGTSNSASLVTTGTRPLAVGVDPISGKAFVANNGSSNVTVITEAGSSGPSNPLTVQVQGAIDPSKANVDTQSLLFATSNASPSFTATVQSLFGPNTPAPTALYYQLDGTQGTWTQATANSSSGANPADYSFSLTGINPGVHTVYAYSVYGGDGGPTAASGSGYAPQTSNVVAYPFAIVNPPTNFTLTASANPLFAGLPLVLQACPDQATEGLTLTYGGTMTFFDGTRKLGSVFIDPTSPTPVVCPTITAYGLAASTTPHHITAAFSGAPFIGSSMVSVDVTVEVGLSLSISIPVMSVPQAGPCTASATTNCPVYGQSVSILAQIAAAGSVNFNVLLNGTPLQSSSVNVVGGRATLVLPKLAAGSYEVDASFTPTTGTATYAASLFFPVKQKPVTITPISLFRFYGAANPVLHETVIGFLPADGITYTFTTTATQSSDATTTPNPCYPININFNDPNSKLSNYALPNPLPTGCLSIYPLPVTVIAYTEVRKVTAKADNFTGTMVGVLAADKADATLSFSSTVPLGAPIGTYKGAITPSISFATKGIDYFVANTIKGTEIITQ